MAFYDITPAKLGQAAITASVTTLYTTPDNVRTFLKSIDVVNTSASTLTFDVYIVPDAGSASAANALFYEKSLTAKENFQWNGTQILNGKETIQIKASGLGVTINISGGEAL